MSVTLRKRVLLLGLLALSIFAACAQETSRSEGEIRGNKRSMIYHWPGCPNYDDIAPHNRVPFQTRAEAEKAGYRAARNCN
jgi:methylphosphotriester-DNA--protein-cysteine methyltransferase